MQGWANHNAPAVSICCVCYNHEKYISDALDSFLAQRTSFKFEVVVRDDCSSDLTTEILKKYKNKFPNIIKLRLESSNQYSKGVKPFSVVSSLATGKYIAMCDGDDFWIDDNKLQAQFDYMERHNHVAMLFENSILLECDINGEVTERRRFNLNLQEGVIEPRQLVNSWIVTTATVFFRNRDLSGLYPKILDLPYGDLPLYLHLAQFGQVHYRDKVSAVYRVLTTGMIKSKVRRLDTAKTMLVFWDRLDELFGQLEIEKATRKQRSQQYGWILWLCIVEKQYGQIPRYAVNFVLSDPVQSLATTGRALKLLALRLVTGQRVDQLK